MYKRLSIRITNFLVHHKFVSEEDTEIYIFSFQIILSTLISSIFIILWAVIFKQTINTILFFIGFFLCRKCSGGYHAKSQFACFIFTQLIFLSFLTIITFFDFLNNKTCMILITLFSNFIIFFLAPVDNENKPLSDTEILKFRKQSKYFILANTLLLLFSLYIPIFFDKYICYILGVSAISLMLILGKFKNSTSINCKINKKGEKYNE